MPTLCRVKSGFTSPIIKVICKKNTKKCCVLKNSIHLLRNLESLTQQILNLAEHIENCFYVRAFEN